MANTENCPKVGIVMGSDSDMPVMAKAADILEELGIPYEMTVMCFLSMQKVRRKKASR